MLPNPELISSLKREVAKERDNWAYVQEKMAYYKKNHTDINRYMKVVPVPFSTEGKNMLIHTKELLEFETPIVAKVSYQVALGPSELER